MDELLAEMRRYAAANRVPIIGAAAAALLEQTVALKQPRSVLEIGTAIGYSTLLIAGKSPVSARIATIELDAGRAAAARQFILRSGLSDRISLLEGDAGRLIPALEGRYDLVFIDAAKGQYLDYLTKLLGKLQHQAVIFADNVLFRGLVASPEAPPRRYKTIVSRLRGYLQFVTADPRFATTVYPTGDGVAISHYQGAVDIATT
ncbi:MAG TPA: O-methyltransferase [Selenomonadales bacterium]|nr:O-methyltransferase [Selenomonadales bacterium]